MKGGINVDNLGIQPFLPWEVFQEANCVLLRSVGVEKRRDAMANKLSELGLSLGSIKGNIARVVYGKKPGDTIFRRVIRIV